jgi:plastocyanin
MARFIHLTVVGLLLGALLTACGGGGAGGTGGTGGLIIEMGDLYYKPDTLTAKPGQTLQITLDNRGSLEHNFVLYDLDGQTVLFEKDALQPGQKAYFSL